MVGIRIVLGVVWVAFWVAWLVWATTSKRTTGRAVTALRGRVIIAATVVVFVRLVRPQGLELNSVVLAAVGLAITLAGLGFAIWARVHLGRNWGMPATIKADPELVTAGPYAFARHPIYTGLVVAFTGTALAFNVLSLLLPLAAGAVFLYSARLEERNLTEQFPVDYPQYKARTKMLIPWVL